MTPAPPPVRTVFLYKKQLLVAKFTSVPGGVLRTVHPAGEQPDVTSTWCSGQCFSREWEPDVLKGLHDCENFDEFIRRMKYFKYRVETEEPRMVRRRFTRL